MWILKYFKSPKHDERALDLTVIEQFMSIAAMAFGLFLLNPFVDTFASAHSFDSFVRLSPEYVWGFVYFFVGLSLNHAYRHESYKMKRNMLMLLGFLWSFLATNFILSTGFASTGIPIYTLFSVYTFWAYVQAGRKSA